jgi:iron complex outermembrane receptor protein
LTTLTAVIIAAPAPAQIGDLTEIVVTARKRDESLLNVPVTVDAFTEQTIRSAGIESPRDFVAMVPNMTLV